MGYFKKTAAIVSILLGLTAPALAASAADYCNTNPTYCTAAPRQATTKVAPVYNTTRAYCQKVTPSSAAMFVPTRTEAEFNSFLNWAPNHPDLTSVVGCSCGDGTLDAWYGSLSSGNYVGCVDGYYTDPITQQRYECPENCDYGAANGGRSPHNFPANCDPNNTPYGGTCVYCAPTCKLTTASGGVCGDSIRQASEGCDNGAANGTVCLPPYNGSCSYCSAGCMVVTLGGGSCGDNVITAPEVCDGVALNGQSCTSRGYHTGTLGCLGDCSDYNVSGCTNCGNGICQAGETWAGCSGDCPQCDFGGTGCCAGTCCAGYVPNGSGGCNPIACYSACGRLHTNEYLRVGDSITSCGGNVRLTVQSDGNAVVLEGSTVIWATGTNGQGSGNNMLTVQQDGNLVLYDGPADPRTALWSSNYVGLSGTLILQDDGNLVVVSTTDCTQVLWAASSCIAAERDACNICYGNIGSCGAPNVCIADTCVAPPDPGCVPAADPVEVRCNFPPGQMFGDSLIKTDSCGAQTPESCPTFSGRGWCANDYLQSAAGAAACLNSVQCGSFAVIDGRLKNMHATNTLGHHVWCYCSTCDATNVAGCGGCYFQ